MSSQPLKVGSQSTEESLLTSGRGAGCAKALPLSERTAYQRCVAPWSRVKTISVSSGLSDGFPSNEVAVAMPGTSTGAEKSEEGLGRSEKTRREMPWVESWTV